MSATAFFLIAMSLVALVQIIVLYSRHRQNKHVQIPSDLTSFAEETVANSVSTKHDLEMFLNEYVEVRSFHTRVVGVTHENDDGTSRQEILSCCLRGEPVGLYWHTFCGDPACAVISDHGQIGFLKAELAADLSRDYEDDRYIFSALISDITGGDSGYSYGCNLLVTIYETM